MNRLAQCLLFGLVALPFPVSGQQDLTSMSLEQILNMDVVSVSKNHAKLSRTAAAVHIITQEDIRRSGATNLPEALRLAPGIHVARINGQSWAIGMRGFNTSTSNKLLVMIDGRSIYNPVMSGVIWSSQLIMLDDVDRIEVIRGPAGSVWGANAVNGVINVVSKSAAATLGTLASVSGGSMDPVRASLRQGAALGPNAAMRTWVHHETNGIGRSNVGQPSQRPWNTTRGGLRADWKPTDRDELELHAEITTVEQDLNIFTYPRPLAIEVVQTKSSSVGGFVLGKWTHTNRRGDQSRLQVFEDVQQNDVGLVGLKVRTFDTDFQHSIALTASHRLTFGGGFRFISIESENRPQLGFSPANRSYHVGNVFLQHEWTLIPNVLALTLGGKLESYTLAGSEFQPSARILWTPTRPLAFWAAVSRAVRAPSHVDYALRFPLGAISNQPLPFTINFLGNGKARPESLRGIEVGTRIQFSSKTLLDVSLYRNSYSRLNDTYQISLELDPQSLGTALALGVPFSIPAIEVNGRDITARGGEIEIHHDLRRWWRLTGSYSGAFLSTRIRPEFDPARIIPLTNFYPKHMAQIRSSWDLGRRWLADLEVYRTAALIDSGLSHQTAFTRADARLEFKLTDSASLSLQGRHLLRPWQTEYPGELLYPNRSIGRSFTLGLRWVR